VVAASVARLESGAPDGVTVEAKGLTVTVHWRRDPARAETAVALVEAEAAATGLEAHRGRMSVELRPPLAIDKGSVTGELVEAYAAACFVGDDLGDLPAFVALDRASETRGTVTVKVAAVDDESAPEVAAAADIVVGGPQGALAVLGWLADRASAGPH
jgi:trehalose 6-phosphate phosphatase